VTDSALLVGVDLGTTGTKAALYRADGTTLAEASADTTLRWQGPGVVDQNPQEFYATAASAIRACLERADVDAGSVEAVGVTGQMAGVLGVDSDWQPSMPYDSWLDLRCSRDVEALAGELGDELVRIGGCPPMVNHAPKLRWRRRERPEEFEATAKFVLPSGYVAGRFAGLAGDEAYVDWSYLHFTGLADTRRGEWSETLTEGVGVPAGKLPRIVDPATVVGRVGGEAASDSGLRQGTPVAAGLGDTAAGVLGAGVVRPGQLLDVAGTAAVLGASTDEHRPDPEHRTLIVMRGAVHGQWVSLAYLSGGSLLSWFASRVAADGGEEEEVDFDALGELVDLVPAGSDGLLFVPHLDGRLLPSDPTMRGAWVGLDRHHGRAHMLRALLEGVAYEYAGYLAVLNELHEGLDQDEVRVIGGGARSGAWNRIKASVLGVPYVRLDRDEFSCWGAALVAGAAVGIYDDLAAAALEATQARERYEPDPDQLELYRGMTELYERVLGGLSGPFHELEQLRERLGKEASWAT
jgi:xylulokinase